MRGHLLTAIIGLMIGPSIAQDGALDKARSYISTLASPAMFGRGYVNGGDSLAADWIAERFEALGLQPLEGRRFQPFSFPVNTFPDSVKVEVDGRRLRPGIDFVVDPASGPDSGTFHLVHLVPEDLHTPERRAMTIGAVMGSAVVLDLPPSKHKDTLAMYRAWEHELVRFVPVFRHAQGKLTWSVADAPTRHALIEVLPGIIPDTASEVMIAVAPKAVPRHHARNVLGMVKARGRSKDWVVVTAHYDHLGMMGPDALFAGANDNASGVAMMLCLAEDIARAPLKHNVLFIAFAGEEAGLHGSRWCVTDRPIDLARIRMLVNLDLNGTGEEGITVVNATEQKAVYRRLVKINARHKRLPQVKERGPACNSDHCPFALKGVPAIFIYTMGGVSHYHDVNDLPATLSLAGFEGLRRNLLDLLPTL